MSHTGTDWRELAATWQTDSGPPADVVERLRHKVRAARRAMIGTLVMEIALLAAVAVLTGWVVVARGGAFWIAWAALVWLLALGVQAFALWNRRGTWRAATLTPIDCLRLSQRRARAKLRTARFVRIAVAVALAAVAALFGLADTDGRARHAMLPTLLACSVVGAAYVAWSLWFQRRARRDLDELARIESMLEE